MTNFSKLQGIGNDFICLKYDDVKQYNLSFFSKYICDRHFGIGGDGIILYSESRIADFKMRIFNQDGTEAQMCGNGIRCLAKYLFDKRIISKEKIIIETLAGLKYIEYVIQNNKVMSIRVNMGKPIMESNRLPVYLPRNYRNIEKRCRLLFKIQDKEFIGTFLTVGNPHTVIEVPELKSFQVEKFGKIIENYKYFPQKTNVEFVQILDRENIKIKVWERGVRRNISLWNRSCCYILCITSCWKTWKNSKC